MDAGRRHRRARRALSVALLACALAAPGASPASDGVLWQGDTPEHGTAVVAGIGFAWIIGRSKRTVEVDDE